MKKIRGTFLLTLPNGQHVRCWKKDALAIRADVAKTGDVLLVKPDGSDVYDRIAPDSTDAHLLHLDPNLRRLA